MPGRHIDDAERRARLAVRHRLLPARRTDDVVAIADDLVALHSSDPVTVYLSGALRPGGVCDVPRIEAQLTQTAVASVGAVRADIYVNGVGLTEALSLK